MKGDKFQMIYRGRRWSGKDRIGYCWYRTDQGEEYLYMKQWIHTASIGQVWEFISSNDENTSFWVAGENKPQFIELVDDEDKITQWIAAERAAMVMEANYRRAKNNKPDDRIEEALNVLNEAYYGLRTGTERTAFLFWCEEELTRYNRRK